MYIYVFFSLHPSILLWTLGDIPAHLHAVLHYVPHDDFRSTCVTMSIMIMYPHILYYLALRRVPHDAVL